MLKVVMVMSLNLLVPTAVEMVRTRVGATNPLVDLAMSVMALVHTLSNGRRPHGGLDISWRSLFCFSHCGGFLITSVVGDGRYFQLSINGGTLLLL